LFSRQAPNAAGCLPFLLFSPKGSNLDSLTQNQVSCQLDEGKIYANTSKNICSIFELLAGIKPTLFLITSEVHHHLCVRSIFILRRETKKPGSCEPGFE